MTLTKPLRRLLAAAAALCLAGALPAAATSLSDAQKSDVEAIVKAYILAHPEIVVDALNAYEQQQKKAEQQQASQAIVENRAEILSEKGGGVAGNPKGDITLVEFFDYRCGYCRQAKPIVTDLIKSDGNIKLVYKEFPILGPDSVTAARAALAARFQGDDKYVPFHDALMNTKGTIDESTIHDLARQVGLDAAKLSRDMNDPTIDSQIKANHAIARKLGINGTPSFVIGDQLVPGFAELDQMKQIVADARKTCKGTC
jgi:protein-disulfide isomerase